MKSVLTTRITVTFSLILMCFVVLSPQVEAQTIVSVDDYVQTVQLPNITTYIVDDVTLAELESSKKVPNTVIPSHSQRGFGSMSRLKSLLGSNQFFSSFISRIPSHLNQEVTQEIKNNDMDPIIESVDGVFVVHDNDKTEIQNYLLQLRQKQPRVQVYPLYLYSASENGNLNPVLEPATVPNGNVVLPSQVITSSPILPVDIVEESSLEIDLTQVLDFENTVVDISNISLLKPSNDLVEETNPIQELIETIGSDINPATLSTLRPEASSDLVEESNPNTQSIPLIGLDTQAQPLDIVEELTIDNSTHLPIEPIINLEQPILPLSAATGESNRFFAFQYQLRAQTQRGGESIAGLDFQRAWDYIAKKDGKVGCDTTGVGGCLGSSNIKIGFVDRGLASGLEDIDYSRVDYLNSSSIVSSTIPCNTAISSQYVTLPMNGTTYYFCELKGVLQDKDGHGTKVVAISSMAHNNLGGIGVAPKATIGMKGLDGEFAYNSLTIAKAIREYAAADYDVINLSLVTGVDDTYIHEAITEAFNSGVTIVGAAGNCGDRNLQGCGFNPTSTVINPPMYPAFYPEVISVGSTEISADLSVTRRSSYSSYGGVNQIMVPIGSKDTVSGNYGVLSVSNDGRYRIRLAFTSYAAPIVSGHIALMKSLDPTLTPQEIIDIINSTALDVGPRGVDPEFGAGVLQPTESLYETTRQQLLVPPIVVSQAQSINSLLTLTPLRNRE